MTSFARIGILLLTVLSLGQFTPAASKSLDGALSALSGQGRTLASRIRSGKPASAEARQMMETVERIETLLEIDGMPDEITTAWQDESRGISKIRQAFDL